MDLTENEQAAVTSHIAEANNDTGENETSASLGKFKDVGALLSAYRSLQAEFTKRCQRVKELEAKIADGDKGEKTSPQTSDAENSGITDKEKEDLLKDYLKDVLGRKSRAIVLDGVGTDLKTPTYKPRTVEEAGRLAKKLLEK